MIEIRIGSKQISALCQLFLPGTVNECTNLYSSIFNLLLLLRKAYPCSKPPPQSLIILLITCSSITYQSSIKAGNLKKYYDFEISILYIYVYCPERIYFFYAIAAELEQGEALRYLSRWLQNHPKYGGLAPQNPTDSYYGPDVSECSVFHNADVSTYNVVLNPSISSFQMVFCTTVSDLWSSTLKINLPFSKILLAVTVSHVQFVSWSY